MDIGSTSRCKERILSEDYFDIIIDFQVRQEENLLNDYCSIDVENLYNMLYVSREEIARPEDYFFSYQTLPKLYGLMQEQPDGFDSNSLLVSGIPQIQREPLNLTGKGCVMVFIDTGIDYSSDVFRNPDGSSRILAIWDQTIQDGTPPQGLYYGSEYTREDINRALSADDPYLIVPSRDESGHGTDMAAVAAGSRVSGSGSVQEFLGAAPDADIVVVKLKPCKKYLRDFYLIPKEVPAYQETDIMLGILYGERFADTFRKPIVYCLGVGTNYGDHEGSAPLPSYLNMIAVKRSRAVVVCGGNEGNAAHHYQGRLNNRGELSTNQEVVELRVGENAQGFLLEIWGNIPDIFTVSIRSPGGETIPAIRLGLQDIVTYGFIYERTRITIVGNLVEPVSGEELILLRVSDPTPGIWNFIVEPAGEIHNGIFHMWLPITAFMNSSNYFLRPDPYTTITEPAMAFEVISVSTYDGSNNSFYIKSGRGYTRTGRVTPDFAAPGVGVSTPGGKKTGSSLAAAISSGAIAQFMQWAVVEGNNNVVESREIKNYFARGASRQYNLTYPNREWGYGRLNMVGTFDALIGV